MLSMHDETTYANRALRAGALGYIMKREQPEKLISAVRTVLRGEVYLSETMASRMLGKYVRGRRTVEPEQAESEVSGLSDRELEVFELLGRGLSTRQIAERLHLSIKTIESHRENIKTKLNFRNAAELVWHATQWVMSEEAQ
jgi:DNA-binding NarL/FixJ family response regulator